MKWVIFILRKYQSEIKSYIGKLNENRQHSINIK